jgi:squalene monooxygenase
MPLILDSPVPSSASSTTSSRTFFTDEKEKRRRDHHDAEVVIVGAGVVGSALAVALANQGRSVVLLERSLKQPDRIVGELLQPGGVQALEKLGLGHCLEGIDSIPVHGYLVTYYGEPVEIPYPYNPGKGDGSRAEGRSFHHGRFVQALRMAAMRHENVTVVESTATELIKNEWTGHILGVEATTRGRKDFYFGHLTVVCDGYASKFRKDFITQAPVSGSKFYGLEMKDAILPAPYHGHVILGDGSPILIYQIGTHETRILVDVKEGCTTALPSAGGIKNHFEKVVVPALPECVRPAFLDAVENSNIRAMPNSWLPPTVNKTPGMILVGDALNMRHPLTGGGMTCGLNDVVLLSNLLSPENAGSLADTRIVMKQMRRFHWRRKDVTSVINILAQALYALFAASSTLSLQQLTHFSDN